MGNSSYSRLVEFKCVKCKASCTYSTTDTFYIQLHIKNCDTSRQINLFFCDKTCYDQVLNDYKISSSTNKCINYNEHSAIIYMM